MAARVAETDLREPKSEFSYLLPTTSIAVTPLQLKTSDKHSLHIGQSATRTGDSSSSTRSANSRHHHLRNNSATIVSTLNNTSIPRPSDTSSAKRPASSPSTPLYFPATSTHFNQQSGGRTEPRSPLSRRQPASRSSHGIQTSTGPPPALSTQRSHTTDSVWKQPATLEGTRHPKYRPHTQKSIDSIINSARLNTDEKGSALASKATSSIRRRPEVIGDNTSTMAGFERRHRGHDEDQDSTLRKFDPVASSHPSLPADEKRSGHATIKNADEQTKTSQEDLFLILATSNSLADNAKDDTLKGERRRVSLDSCRSYYNFAPSFYKRLSS